jgi:ABC-type antimicrobial peptide transport system permease subunit
VYAVRITTETNTPLSCSIANVKELLKSTAKTTTALLGFFDVVAAIAVILCFFILTISFTANVRDNSWEFGVLRAVGMSVNQLIRAYIYEALCLVVAAFACGTVIGVVIAMTLVAQFNVFLEMPFHFAFPYWLFLSLAAMALIVAVLGSYIPARVLRRKEIALVLRGLD